MYFFNTESLKSGMNFLFRVHLNLDQWSVLSSHLWLVWPPYWQHSSRPWSWFFFLPMLISVFHSCLLKLKDLGIEIFLEVLEHMKSLKTLTLLQGDLSQLFGKLLMSLSVGPCSWVGLLPQKRVFVAWKCGTRLWEPSRAAGAPIQHV